MNRPISVALGLLVLQAALFGCGDDPERGGSVQSDRSAAPLTRLWPGREWAVQRPEEQGMDSASLERVREYAFEAGRDTQAVVVVRGGAVVAEWYAEGSHADSWVTSWSVAKSFAGALVGIAMDEGLIESVDVSMANYIPSWAGTRHAKIRLRDVLQQASGLSWNEDFNPLNILVSDAIQLSFQDGTELAFSTDRPLAHEPGSVFNYSSGNGMLLSAVIQAAVGMPAAEYARKKLFEPLGMTKHQWWQSTAGHTLTYCCIDTTSRDLARFGLLYARGGLWENKQLVSSKWVAESLAPSPARAGYGYQLWLLGKSDQEGAPTSPPEPSTLPLDMFAAIGLDQELIYVVPHLDLVVVRNGTYIKEDAQPVATGGLFWHLPPMGLSDTLGTTTPSSWRNDDFMHLVLAAVFH